MAWINIAAALVFVLALHQAGCQRISTVRIGENRYFVSWHSPYSPRLNFHLAYQYCRTIAMELVSFETAEEAQLLTDYLRTTASERNPVRDFWTSGNALGSDAWLWMSNGAPLNGTFNYWRNGAAPERSDGACLLQAESAQVWQSTNCAEANHFVCEQTRCYFYNFNPFQKNILATSANVAAAAAASDAVSSARANYSPATAATAAEEEDEEEDGEEEEDTSPLSAPSGRSLRLEDGEDDSLAIDFLTPPYRAQEFQLPPATILPLANQRVFLFQRQKPSPWQDKFN